MKISAVVVTYRPGPIAELLHALTDQCDQVIIVDNTPGGESGLAEVSEALGAVLLLLGENMGIAAAQNVGIDYALKDGADAVLLSDQDSILADGMVATLAQHLGPGIGAVGPVPVEGSDVLVYTDHEFGPKRPATLPDTGEIEVSFLLASGCLIPADVLEDIGTMNSALFIDHVDLEWGMRARQSGYRLLAIRDAVLEHRLGDSVVKLPGRAQVVHVHGPLRNYYLIRNTIALIKTTLLPIKWRIRYVYWIVRFAVFNLLVNPDRSTRLHYVVRGFTDGWKGRLGRYGN